MFVAPQITCGCGFTITGTDEARNQDVFDSHGCVLEGDSSSWHDNLFSFWGFLIALVLMVAATGIVELIA